MRLLESTKKYVDKDKDGKDMPKLESVEIFLVHCKQVNSNYQQGSKVSVLLSYQLNNLDS